VLSSCHWRSLYLPFLLLPVSGCVPFVYPTTSLTPLVSPGEDVGEVYAFRVDTAKTRFFGHHLGIDSDEHTLTPISASNDLGVFPQGWIGLAWGGFYGIGSWAGGWANTHTVSVRLYRPGYELVEVHSWDFFPRVVWKETATPEDAMRELDRLLETRRIGAAGEKSNAAPGREVLLWAAREYERLAHKKCANPPGPALFEELQAKARKCRELAGEQN
jgi:hypothetical protein